MSRAGTLIAAIVKQTAAIGRLAAAPSTLKREAALRTDVATLKKYVKELAGLSTAPVIVVAAAAPDQGLSMAGRARAWDHTIALDNIHAVLDRDTDNTATPEESRAMLGDGLFGQAICLWRYGAPGENPAIDYSLGDPYGGVWGAQSGGGSGAFTVTVWNGSQIVFTSEPSGMPVDAMEIARAHGVNDNGNGPRDDVA